MDFDARDFSCGRHGIVGVAGVEEPRVRRLTAGGERIRTFGSAMRLHRRQRGRGVTPPDPDGE
jgi:hypothetical protein